MTFNGRLHCYYGGFWQNFLVLGYEGHGFKKL